MINIPKTYYSIFIMFLCLLSAGGCSQGSGSGSRSLEDELSNVLNCPRDMLQVVRDDKSADYVVAACGERKYNCVWDEIPHERRVGGMGSDFWEEYFTRGPLKCSPR